ncbi:MAG: Crp/Fnr family transcriptional regulator [Lachnospiraceae bacterium]|nr:Crp/Fnr family transcriptional regulator [Lachnospiraceae bacterium]
METKNGLFDCFFTYGEKIVVEKSKIIYAPDNKAQTDSLYYLESGLVALMSYSRGGEERVYLYMKGPRIISFMTLLLSVTNSQEITGNVVPSHLVQMTKTRCILHRMQGSTFRKLLDEDLRFNRLMLQATAANFQEVLSHFQQALEDSASVRLCRLLLDFYVVKDGKKVLPKTMSFLEMSKYLGTHPVTVSRIVAILKKDGCIVKEQGSVIIQDEKRLLQMIENGIDIK